MIVHETPGMKLPAGLVAGFAKGGEEGAALDIIAKDRLAPVAAIHEVADGSWKLNAQRSWHRSRKPSKLARIVNC